MCNNPSPHAREEQPDEQELRRSVGAEEADTRPGVDEPNGEVRRMREGCSEVAGVEKPTVRRMSPEAFVESWKNWDICPAMRQDMEAMVAPREEQPEVCKTCGRLTYDDGGHQPGTCEPMSEQPEEVAAPVDALEDLLEHLRFCSESKWDEYCESIHALFAEKERIAGLRCTCVVMNGRLVQRCKFHGDREKVLTDAKEQAEVERDAARRKAEDYDRAYVEQKTRAEKAEAQVDELESNEIVTGNHVNELEHQVDRWESAAREVHGILNAPATTREGLPVDRALRILSAALSSIPTTGETDERTTEP